MNNSPWKFTYLAKKGFENILISFEQRLSKKIAYIVLLDAHKILNTLEMANENKYVSQRRHENLV